MIKVTCTCTCTLYVSMNWYKKTLSILLITLHFFLKVKRPGIMFYLHENHCPLSYAKVELVKTVMLIVTCCLYTLNYM